MSKILEKSLRDARKEDKLTMGTKQVLNSIKNSKLIVLSQSIKLTTDQMRMMSLFQNVTGATARDCVEDEKQDRVIFVVNTGKMGLAIGKGGIHIKSLQNIVKRNVELVEFDEDPAKFLTN